MSIMLQELQVAIVEGKVEYVDQLVKANPLLLTSRDEHGWTPLLRAAYAGQDEVVKLLLSRGAPVNDRDQDGYGFSALHWAAQQNNPWLILTVGSHQGVDVNLQDLEARTALYVAASEDNLLSVGALLLVGADPRVPTQEGDKACHHTSSRLIRKLLEVAERLWDRGCCSRGGQGRGEGSSGQESYILVPPTSTSTSTRPSDPPTLNKYKKKASYGELEWTVPPRQ